MHACAAAVDGQLHRLSGIGIAVELALGHGLIGRRVVLVVDDFRVGKGLLRDQRGRAARIDAHLHPGTVQLGDVRDRILGPCGACQCQQDQNQQDG